MTPQEKKELDYVVKTAVKVFVFIAVLSLVLFTVANYLIK